MGKARGPRTSPGSPSRTSPAIWAGPTGRGARSLVAASTCSRTSRRRRSRSRSAPKPSPKPKKQYPFNRALSQAVAKALGIRHPTYPGTNIPCVMTIDLLATVHRPRDTVHIGIDCKTRDQVEDPRVLEKLELNRAILAETGSLHVIFFDSLIPKQLIRNLRWINSGRANPKELLPYPDSLTEVTERMYRHLSSTVFDDRPLRVVCEEFDEASSQQPGTGLRAAKLLIDSYRLDVDLNAPDLPDRPLSDFRIQDSENVNIRKAV